jgi:hypothetical protein
VIGLLLVVARHPQRHHVAARELHVDVRLVAAGVVVGAAVVVIAAVVARKAHVEAVLLGAALVIGVPLGGSRIATRGVTYGGWPLVLAALAAVALAATSRDDDVGLVPCLLSITLVGCWLCLPDVELPLAAIGALAALAVWSLARPPARAASFLPGALIAVPLLVIAAVGGKGRPASEIGAIACVGVLGVWPVAAALARRIRPEATRRVAPAGFLALAGLIQVPVCVYLSRVAGLRTDTGEALALAVPGLAVALAATTTLLSVVRPRSGGQLPTEAGSQGSQGRQGRQAA